ncbi:MAG: 2-hydroxyacyl-CoA dehydratase subunit D [Lachnospiraceae bacterium]
MTLQGYIDTFHEIAINPKKQKEKYLAEGKEIVLTAPVYTPNEIIHSMGFVPMGAWGGDLQIQEAKQYFPAFICSVMQSVLELGMKGTFSGVSAIVIPSLCDSLKVLGENWKYAISDIPFIPMTYPQNRKPEFGKQYTIHGYERVITDLEKLGRKAFSKESLARSIEIYNEHNAVMREFARVCPESALKASERSDVFKSAFFLLLEEHTKLVNGLLAALQAEGARKSTGQRVYLTGILADSPSLLQIFDENDINIAGDDIAAASRQYRVDVPKILDPLEAVAVKFQQMDHCCVLYDPTKGRVEYILREAEAVGAKGILHIQTKFCDPEEFDYPLIKKACAEHNMPLIQIETDRQMSNYEQARTMIQTFVEMME